MSSRVSGASDSGHIGVWDKGTRERALPVGSVPSPWVREGPGLTDVSLPARCHVPSSHHYVVCLWSSRFPGLQWGSWRLGRLGLAQRHSSWGQGRADAPGGVCGHPWTREPSRSRWLGHRDRRPRLGARGGHDRCRLAATVTEPGRGDRRRAPKPPGATSPGTGLSGSCVDCLSPAVPRGTWLPLLVLLFIAARPSSPHLFPGVLLAEGGRPGQPRGLRILCGEEGTWI